MTSGSKVAGVGQRLLVKNLSTNSPRNVLKTLAGNPMRVCGSYNHPVGWPVLSTLS
jgi:hypothetical protein